jgi:uncharacterized protein HemX
MSDVSSTFKARKASSVRAHKVVSKKKDDKAKGLIVAGVIGLVIGGVYTALFMTDAQDKQKKLEEQMKEEAALKAKEQEEKENFKKAQQRMESLIQSLDKKLNSNGTSSMHSKQFG